MGRVRVESFSIAIQPLMRVFTLRLAVAYVGPGDLIDDALDDGYANLDLARDAEGDCRQDSCHEHPHQRLTRIPDRRAHALWKGNLQPAAVLTIAAHPPSASLTRISRPPMLEVELQAIPNSEVTDHGYVSSSGTGRTGAAH